MTIAVRGGFSVIILLPAAKCVPEQVAQNWFKQTVIVGSIFVKRWAKIAEDIVIGEVGR